ncbi:MAG TPA: hypothetical protein VKS25_13000 [Solirubrobacteraceae bacterium]|nr:hypothetical protein [Solirubrobacteraceae bacterium]
MIILNITLMVLVAVAIVGLLSYAIVTSVDHFQETTAGSADVFTLPAPAAASNLRHAA